jgi:iron complex transport system ATP-binding protein
VSPLGHGIPAVAAAFFAPAPGETVRSAEPESQNARPANAYLQDRAGQAGTQTPRLSVEQASYAYAARGSQTPEFTLEATSFHARQGELVAILGPNASGKSTLLKLVAGTLEPLSGRVLLDGFETARLDSRTRAQRIAVVLQESQLLFPCRTWEFVLQGRHPYGRSLRFASDKDVSIASNALEQVAARHLASRWMDQISGGEKQRVILARALAQQPLLLLLDEPTLHLDIGAQVGLLENLRRLAAENRYTVVVVTHELALAGEYADQVVLLHRGKCLRVGLPAAVYQRDLLEQVFETTLTVELGPTGRPRVSALGK